MDLELLLRHRLERQSSVVVLGDEGVAQSLKGCQAVPWVDLQDLLHEVDELENSESLLHAVGHRQLVVVLVSEHIMSMLHFQLLDMPLLKKLPKVEEGVISLRHVVAVLLVESH